MWVGHRNKMCNWSFYNQTNTTRSLFLAYNDIHIFKWMLTNFSLTFTSGNNLWSNAWSALCASVIELCTSSCKVKKVNQRLLQKSLLSKWSHFRKSYFLKTVFTVNFFRQKPFRLPKLQKLDVWMTSKNPKIHRTLQHTTMN